MDNLSRYMENINENINEISKNINIKIKDITEEETLNYLEKNLELLNSVELKTKICIKQLKEMPELLVLKNKKSEIEKSNIRGSVGRAERFSDLEKINNEITNKQFDMISDIYFKYKTKIEGHENSIKILQELISNEMGLSVPVRDPILKYDLFKDKIKKHEEEIETSKIMISMVHSDGKKRKSLKRKRKSLKRKRKSLKRKV